MPGSRLTIAVLAISIGAASACSTGTPGPNPTGSHRTPSPIPSGVFVSANFHPQVRFRFPGDLNQTTDRPTLIAVDDGALPQLNLMVVGEVYDPRYRGAVAAPDDLVAWLRSNPYLRTGPPIPTTVGGLTAT